MSNGERALWGIAAVALAGCATATEVRTTTVVEVTVAACTEEQSRAGMCPRPPPPSLAAGCSMWEGAMSGNDPSVMVRFLMCGESPSVAGRFQFSSARSGWSEREVAGEVAAGSVAVVLRDVAMPVSRPAPGWRFCLIDRYELRLSSPDRLTGEYWSAACRDHATIDLRRVQ